MKKINLSYESLKDFRIYVELKEEINMGNHKDVGVISLPLESFGYKINENQDLIIEKGSKAWLQVQTFNFHYEIMLPDTTCFDLAVDTDDELNRIFKFIEISGDNTYTQEDLHS